MCTILCADESVCMQHHGCYDVGGGTKVCVPSDSGRSCPTGQPTNCFAGICLVHPSDVTKSECATPCSSVHACPNGFSCSLTQVGSNTERVCTRVGATCTAQGVSTECITRFCAAQQTTPTDGVCVAECRDDLDCPDGYGCGLDDNGSVTVSMCQPIGEACTDNGTTNDCYSKTCAIVSGNTGYCTVLCMNDQLVEESARCPPAYQCVSVPVSGQTWYACSM